MKTSTTSLKNASLLGVLALIASNTLSFGSAQAIGLVNPNFEADDAKTLVSVVPGDSSYESSSPTRTSPAFVVTNQSNITGWKTTATTFGGAIELWESGFNAGGVGAVLTAPGNGNQFAEVNATENSALYQDLTIAASGSPTRLYFDLWHRARADSSGNPQINAIAVTITNQTTSTQLFNAIFATQLNPSDIGTTNGWARYTSDSFANIFAAASGSAQVIRFAFTATTLTNGTADIYTTTGVTPTVTNNATVSTTNSNITTGNFIDNANFADTPIPFDFSPNIGIGILGALYLGNKAIHSLRNKKDINS